MSDRRNFEVKFQEAKAATGKFDNASGKVRGYADAISTLADGLVGESSIASMRNVIKALAEDLVSESVRMKKCADAARDCIYYYESAEAQLNGVRLSYDDEKLHPKQDVITPTIPDGKKDIPEMKVVEKDKKPAEEKPGESEKKDTEKKNTEKKNTEKKDIERKKDNEKKKDTGKPKDTSKPVNNQKPPASQQKPKSNDEKLKTRSDWVEDVWEFDGKGGVYHYKKAYINRKGKVTAYTKKTYTSARTFFDLFSKDEKHKKLKLQDTIDGLKINDKSKVDGVDSRKWVRKDGKWLSPAELEAEKDLYMKKVGTIAEVELFKYAAEGTLVGAEVESESTGFVSQKSSAKAKVISGEAKAVGKFGAYLVMDKEKNFHTAYGFNAQADASFALAKAEASTELSFFAHNILGIQGSADAKVGFVNANLGGCAQWIPGKGFEVYASAGAGAYVFEASASGGVNVLGVKANVGASINFGIGVDGKVGFKDWKFQCEFGMTLGLGAKITLDVDLSGLVQHLKDIYDWIFESEAEAKEKEKKKLQEQAKENKTLSSVSKVAVNTERKGDIMRPDVKSEDKNKGDPRFYNPNKKRPY